MSLLLPWFGTAAAAFTIKASANITASGEATTAQLTAPAGKTSGANFQAGRLQDDENPTDAIDLAADKYTEIEWSIKATVDAEVDATYEFQVVANDTALTTYSQTPTLTVESAYTLLYNVESNPAGNSLYADADWRLAIRKSVAAGQDYLRIDLPWQDIELTEGDVETYGFERIVSEGNGLPLWVNLKLIDYTGVKRLPTHLAGLAFDHASVLAGMDDLLDAIKVAVPTMLGISLGSEVESYLIDHAAEVTPFATLMASARTKAQALWGGAVHVTCSFRNDTAAVSTSWDDYTAIHAETTIPCLTYYFINGDFTFKDTNPGTMGTTIGNEFSAINGVLGEPWMFEEYGGPSAASLNSSDTLQDNFVEASIAVLELYASFGLITAVSWQLQNDIPEWVLDLLGLPPGNQRDFMGSLGFRHADNSNKPAWPRLVTAMGGTELLEFAIPGVQATSAVGATVSARTVAVTGVSSSGAVGTLTASLSGDVTLALTGVTSTGSRGTLAPTTSRAVTGTAGTGAGGTVGQTHAQALTGLTGTGSPGTLTETRDQVLTGTSATGSLGTTTATPRTLALTGVTSTGSVGTLTATTGAVAALTGVTSTASVGTLTAVGGDVAGALTGVTATGSVGSVTETRSQTLTGVSSTTAIGALTSTDLKALTGVTSTGARGTVTASVTYTQALTGVQGTGTAGTVTQTHGGTVALTGVSATSAIGTVGAAAGGVQALTGVAATGARGTVAPTTAPVLVGKTATGTPGTLSHTQTVVLSGVQASGAVGTLVTFAILPTADYIIRVAADDVVVEVAADDITLLVKEDDLVLV